MTLIQAEGFPYLPYAIISYMGTIFLSDIKLIFLGNGTNNNFLINITKGEIIWKDSIIRYFFHFFTNKNLLYL